MNKSKRTKFVVALLVLALATLLTFSVSAQEAEQLRMGITDDEATWNPYTYVTGYPGWDFLLMQYDTLYTLDTDGVPQFWLVANAETSDDGMTVTLDLREDVNWQDGEPLMADDVKFTFDLFKEFTHGRFTRSLQAVDSVEVVGDYRLIVTLTAPSPSLNQSTFADVPIMPEHIWSEIEDPINFDYDIDVNVGSGPYRMTQYKPDQFYVFEANADYFAGAPRVAELVVIQYADMTGMLAALQAGEVDMLVEVLPAEQVDLLRARGDIEVIQGPLFETNMLVYDMERPPFDQLVVRQAMSLALDRQDIADTVYLGAATVGNVGWTHPESSFFNNAVVTEYDPARAQAMLDEAGIVDSDGDGIRELDGVPLSFEFMAPSTNPGRIRTAELSSAMLKEIGIDAVVTVIERSTLVQAVWPDFDVSLGREYEMSMFGWSAPVQADPLRVPILVMTDPADGPINITGYSSERMDELAGELTVTLDRARQGELMDEIQVLIAQDLPFIMIAYPDGQFAYRPDVYDGWAYITGQGPVTKLSFLPADARP